MLHKSSSPDNYEFNQNEERIVSTTASRTKAWAIVSLIIGGLGALGSLGIMSLTLIPGLIALVDAVVNIVVGVIFLQTAGALQSIVETEGHDIAHLMQAMEKLGVAFLVQLIAALIGFIAGLILGVGGAL